MGKRVAFFQIGVGVDFLVLLPTVVTQCQLKGVLLWCVFSLSNAWNIPFDEVIQKKPIWGLPARL